MTVTKKTIYSFCVAFKSEEELEQIQATEQLDTTNLVYKTLYCSAFSEEEAMNKVDEYVKKTSYKNIVDGKFV